MGKWVYAVKKFKKDEVVIQYHFREVTKDEYRNLSHQERLFTHVHKGKIMLYGEPERYVNHSETPNTYQDFTLSGDRAMRDISAVEMITTDATKDDFSVWTNEEL